MVLHAADHASELSDPGEQPAAGDAARNGDGGDATGAAAPWPADPADAASDLRAWRVLRADAAGTGPLPRSARQPAVRSAGGVASGRATWVGLLRLPRRGTSADRACPVGAGDVGITRIGVCASGDPGTQGSTPR